MGEFLAFYGQQYCTMVVAQRSLADLRGAVFERLQRFPMRFFDRNPVGKVVSRVTTDVDVLSEMFAAGAMTIALDGLKLLGVVAFMLWIDWQLALASLVLLPPMTFAIDFFRRMARRTLLSSIGVPARVQNTQGGTAGQSMRSASRARTCSSCPNVSASTC